MPLILLGELCKRMIQGDSGGIQIYFELDLNFVEFEFERVEDGGWVEE